MPSKKLLQIVGKATEVVAETAATLPLHKIHPRQQDTRPTDDAHVQALADSIAIVGLIQPLAVDAQGVLLAGAHRLAAIEHLEKHNQDAFDRWFKHGVPVRRYEFDALKESNLALEIEAIENTNRKNYTPEEVRGLAERLKAAGYNYTPGKPKSGQRSLIPSLSMIVGKSDKTIRRYLSEDDQSKSGHLTELEKSLRSTKRALSQLLEHELEDEVAELVGTLLDRLEGNDTFE